MMAFKEITPRYTTFVQPMCIINNLNVIKTSNTLIDFVLDDLKIVKGALKML